MVAIMGFNYVVKIAKPIKTLLSFPKVNARHNYWCG